MSLKKFLTSNVFFKQVAIAIVIIIILVFVMMRWLNFTTNHGQQIQVPNLTKLTEQQVAEKLENIDLEYIILDTVEYKADFPIYSVVQQDPLPNVAVKKNRKIYIKVNAGGYNTLQLPDLIQKTYRQVGPTIKAIGLEEGNITYVPYLAKDIVLEVRQNGKRLNPGDKVLKASKIDLVLGDGKTGFDENEFESTDIDETQINLNE